MTLFVSIGGTAAQPETACHSVSQWEALLDATARGDVAAVMRLIALPPKMVPTANLHPVAAEDAGKHAGEFWRKYAERHGAAKPAKRGQTEVSVAPNRSSGEVNEVLRRITEGPKK